MFYNYHWWTTEDRYAHKEGTVDDEDVLPTQLDVVPEEVNPPPPPVPQSLARFACGLGMDDEEDS